MSITIPTFATDAHTVRENTTDVVAIAEDWLYAKDIENAAKPAEKVRKAAGVLLDSLLGKGGVVTVNKGGFRQYVLKCSDVKGRPSGERALDAMVADGIITPAQAASYLEASRGEGFRTISLAPVKL